jgi:DNA repair protein RecO (recombination protein O)
MPGTYKATGINLKAMPIGETDRLVTVLTQEYGLVRLVAPGSRKHQSSLRGRSGVFVVNQLLIAKGRSLDKIIQAETIESYAGLSQDLRKLTASQYLAELVLCQALSDHPQEELFSLLREHLSRIERFPAAYTLPCLVHGTFHLLALAGLAPRVHACCVTQEVLEPDFHDPTWRVGFSSTAGGIVKLGTNPTEKSPKRDRVSAAKPSPSPLRFKEQGSTYSGHRHGSGLQNKGMEHEQDFHQNSPKPKSRYVQSRPAQMDTLLSLGAMELAVLQHLSQPDLLQADGTLVGTTSIPADQFPAGQSQDELWLALERALRHYAQFHFERSIRSATLVEACFLTSSPLPP